MAMNFAKNNRSVAFNPTSAFPLDARSYFESLESAQAAAAKAEEVGSTNTIYYYGQIISVVENSIATLYIIQPNKTLTPLISEETGEQIEFKVDSKQFVFDDNGLLSLKDFDSANINKILTIGNDGTLCWVDPIDTYTKNEIDVKIAEASHLKRKIVSSVADIALYMETYNDADQYIFMVPREALVASDKYDEYIVIKTYNEDGEEIAQEIEAVGTWEVTLDDYVKNSELENYAPTEKVVELISESKADILASINPEAEKNIINGVSTDFTIDDRILKLNQLSQEKIIGLDESLSKKVDKEQDKNLLLSEEDRNKLNALSLDGDNLQISGKVNVSQVEDLEEWLNDHAGTVAGLSENNLNTSLFNKISESLFIKSVDEDQLSVDTSGHLEILTITQQQVQDLPAALNSKASTSQVASLESNIVDIEGRLNTITATVNDNTNRLDALQEQLIWKTII